MLTLIISQRAVGNPNFRLNDTPGHGRFDIIPRVILSSLRPIAQVEPTLNEVITFLKGTDPHGWLYLKGQESFLYEDENSIAADLKERWESYWNPGDLTVLVSSLNERKLHWVELAEDGIPVANFLEECSDLSRLGLIVGAQQDITEEDRDIIQILTPTKVSLGNSPLLASQAIQLFRMHIHTYSEIKTAKLA